MLLARVAEQEAQLSSTAADPDALNLQIDRVLSSIGNTFSAAGKETPLSKTLSWDAVFAFFCCVEAGFKLPCQTFQGNKTLIQSVDAWEEWASSVDQLSWFSFDSPDFTAQKGDLVILNRIPTENIAARIGIILSYAPGNAFISTAEGTPDKTMGFFVRRHNTTIRGFIRLGSEFL